MRQRLLANLIGIGTAAGLALLVVGERAIGVPNPPPLTGALFTTDSTCTKVNGNIYANKTDVYLDGGPATPGAAGLPDGQYYYQITDPSGATLLAGPFAPAGIPDTSAKTITVVNGEFTTCLQLAPFNDTPNPGNEYKVWVTRVTDFNPGGANFGFVDALSKTDNFKVKSCPPATICVYVFNDCDGDCERDCGEPLFKGVVTICVSLPGAPMICKTTCEGTACFCDLLPGEYTVSVEDGDGDNCIEACPDKEVTVDCGDHVCVELGVHPKKY
jgi:hypothetical protein